MAAVIALAALLAVASIGAPTRAGSPAVAGTSPPSPLASQSHSGTDPATQEESEYEAVLALLASGPVNNSLTMGRSVKLVYELRIAGRLDEADEVSQAVLRSAHGNGPQGLRHRHFLIQGHVRRAEMREAQRRLIEQDQAIAKTAAILVESPQWTLTHASAVHLQELDWASYFMALGAIDQAFHYRETGRSALSTFLESVGTRAKAFHRQFTHAEFEAELAFAAGRYRTAVEGLDDWIGRLESFPDVNDLSPEARSSELEGLRRLRASGLQLLATDGDGDPEVAREALQASLAAARGSHHVELDLVFALVRLESSLGPLGDIRSCASLIPNGDFTAEEACLAAALRLACSASADAPALAKELDERITELIGTWLETEPRAAGSGWLHYNRTRYALNTALRYRLGVTAPTGWSSEVIEGVRSTRALDSLLPAFRANDLERRMGASSLTSCAQLQRHLRDGESALVLSPGPSAGVGFLISADSVAAFPLAPKARCKDAVARLRGIILETPARSQEGPEFLARWDRASSGVVDAFFPSTIVRELVDSETVVIFARGLALRLPLEFLRLNGEPLCLTTTVADVPTPAILAELRSKAELRSTAARDSGRLGTALLANLNHPPDLPSIALSDDLLRRWMDQAPGPAPAELFQGDGVDLAAFRNGLLRGRQLGVIYAHGAKGSDPERPAAIALEKAPDQPAGSGATEGIEPGTLDSADLESVDVADVMLLAACGSSKAPQRVGAWGSNHLGGACLMSGARAVILSPDDLPAAATAELIEAFLGFIQEGETLGSALMHARRQIAASSSGSVPPTDYALPILFGLPEVRLVDVEGDLDSPNSQGPDPKGPDLQGIWGLALAAACAAAAAVALVRRMREPAQGTDSRS